VVVTKIINGLKEQLENEELTEEKHQECQAIIDLFEAAPRQ
jgi:hypothetical protein